MPTRRSPRSRYAKAPQPSTHAVEHVEHFTPPKRARPPCPERHPRLFAELAQLRHPATPCRFAHRQYRQYRQNTVPVPRFFRGTIAWNISAKRPLAITRKVCKVPPPPDVLPNRQYRQNPRSYQICSWNIVVEHFKPPASSTRITRKVRKVRKIPLKLHASPAPQSSISPKTPRSPSSERPAHYAHLLHQLQKPLSDL